MKDRQKMTNRRRGGETPTQNAEAETYMRKRPDTEVLLMTQPTFPTGPVAAFARRGRNAAVTKYCAVQLVLKAARRRQWRLHMHAGGSRLRGGGGGRLTPLPIALAVFRQHGLAKRLGPVVRLRRRAVDEYACVVDETGESEWLEDSPFFNFKTDAALSENWRPIRTR